MKILVTGAEGFIGKNLIVELENRDYKDIYKYDVNSREEELDRYCLDCNFIFHLAGINRPKSNEEFIQGNFDIIYLIIKLLKKNKNSCPIVMSSSIQAVLDNPYGKSKKSGEDLLLEYSKESGALVYVYRFYNVFGKWCRPNYNSVIATFCNNIANDLPVEVHDSNVVLDLIYIDDVIEELLNTMKGKANKIGDYCYVSIVHKIKLCEILELLYSFKESRLDFSIPDMTEGGFIKKLYSTYLSYLPKEKFLYPLKMNMDNRGSFTEVVKTPERGQFSINISKSGVTKGEHWHHTKSEKFLVVSGKGKIQLRKVGTSQIIEYHVSGDKLEIVDIPVGYTHNITNEGETELITVMWCNEYFNIKKPDTFYLKVNEDNKDE